MADEHQHSVVDRLGRPLHPDDLVVCDSRLQPLIRVVAIKDQLDPSGPPGHIVEAITTYSFFVPSGRPALELLQVRSADAETERPGGLHLVRPS